MKNFTSNIFRTLLVAVLSAYALMGMAQLEATQQANPQPQPKVQTEVAPSAGITKAESQLLDSLQASSPRQQMIEEDTLKLLSPSADSDAEQDKLQKEMKKSQRRMGRDWSTWRPDTKKALWLAIVIPGGGQIYNRKYWKLPIFYGGFVGCIYALRWNGQMYKDYSQAYLDIMDDDPRTESYNQFLHLGTTITSSNLERYKSIFKNRKDKYRRWRDLSFFCLLGVYAISIVDAYVDAEMSNFDISRDLSMKVRPTVMHNNSGSQGTYTYNPLKTTSLGVQCSLNF